MVAPGRYIQHNIPHQVQLKMLSSTTRGEIHSDTVQLCPHLPRVGEWTFHPGSPIVETGGGDDDGEHGVQWIRKWSASCVGPKRDPHWKNRPTVLWGFPQTVVSKI